MNQVCDRISLVQHCGRRRQPGCTEADELPLQAFVYATIRGRGSSKSGFIADRGHAQRTSPEAQTDRITAGSVATLASG